MLDASLGQLDERLLASLRAEDARRRRRKVLIGGTLMFAAILAAALGFFLSQGRPPQDRNWGRISPFMHVEVTGDTARVSYDGQRYELVSIEDVPTAQILSFCRKTYGDIAEKRFAEDLVEVLYGMGKQPGKTVKLELRDPQSGELQTVERAEMTHENRQIIWRQRNQTVRPEDRSRAAKLAAEGWELRKNRDLTSAREKFEEATDLDPRDANHWNGLGWATYQSGDITTGEKAFQIAIDLEPEHPAARNGLGYLNFDQRKYEKAEEHWLVAVKNPNATAPYYGMAKMYLLTEQFDKALVYSEKALKLNPADKSLKRMVDAAKAKRLSPELRKQIEPAEPDVWGKQSRESAKGWQHFFRGQHDEAKEAFEAALKKNPNEMPAHNGLGFVLLNSGKIADAKKHFEICLQADPKAGGPLNGLARCLKAEGKLDEAIATWEKLADLAPGVNAATYGLAEAYLEKGEYAKSVEQYERLVEAEPQNTQLKEGLERAKKALAEKPERQ